MKKQTGHVCRGSLKKLEPKDKSLPQDNRSLPRCLLGSAMLVNFSFYQRFRRHFSKKLVKILIFCIAIDGHEHQFSAQKSHQGGTLLPLPLRHKSSLNSSEEQMQLWQLVRKTLNEQVSLLLLTSVPFLGVCKFVV